MQTHNMDEFSDYVTGLQIVVSALEDSYGTQNEQSNSSVVVEELGNDDNDNVISNGNGIEHENAIILKNEDGTETAYISSNHNGSVYVTNVMNLKTCENSGDLVSIEEINDEQHITEQFNGCSPNQENEEVIVGVPLLELDGSESQVTSYNQPVTVPLKVDSLQLPIQNAAVSGIHSIPVEGQDELQSACVSSTQQIEVENQPRPMMIAASDTDGNCYYVQRVEVVDSTPIWRRKETKSKVNVNPGGSKGSIRGLRNRVIVDHIKTIPVPEYKAQLNDTSDIINKMDLAPSSKKMIKYLTTRGVAKLFAYPGRTIPSKYLFKYYSRHLTSEKQDSEPIEDMELLPVGYQPAVDPSKIKRITRKRRYPEAEEYKRRMRQEQMKKTFENLVAESQKSMEAVILENTASLEGVDHGNLQILVEAAENDSLDKSVESKVVHVYSNGQQIKDEDHPSQIIVIQSGDDSSEDSSSMQQSIEVLLAAAESGEEVVGESDVQQVVICSNNMYDPNYQDPLMISGDQQIIIVQDSLEELGTAQTETVVTS